MMKRTLVIACVLLCACAAFGQLVGANNGATITVNGKTFNSASTDSNITSDGSGNESITGTLAVTQSVQAGAPSTAAKAALPPGTHGWYFDPGNECNSAVGINGLCSKSDGLYVHHADGTSAKIPTSSASGAGTGNMTTNYAPSVLTSSNIAVLCMGDSIMGNLQTAPTTGVNVTGMCSYVTQTPALAGKVSYVANYAQSGSQTSYLATEYSSGGFASICHQSKKYTTAHGGTATYDMVLMLIFSGTNDVWSYNVPAEGYSGNTLGTSVSLTNLHNMWTQANTDGCTVVGMTVPYHYGINPSLADGGEVYRVAMNNGIRASLGGYFDYLLDLDTLIGDANSYWYGDHSSYSWAQFGSGISADGIHWADGGHRLAASWMGTLLMTGSAPAPISWPKPYFGKATLASGSKQVQFTVPFPNTNYICLAQDTTTPANPVTCTPSDMRYSNCTGTGSDNFTYLCAQPRY